MQCGAKSFLVEMIINGKRETTSVIARTQVTARKTIRNHYGNEVEIISVKENNKIGV